MELYDQCVCRLLLRVADFDDPLNVGGGSGTAAGAQPVDVDEMSVASLVSMGFAREHAIKALKNTVS